MRQTGTLLICASLLLASSALAREAPQEPGSVPRFVARAKLDHQPSAQSDVRFALRATLLPSYPTRPLDAAGVVMNAVLAPKSAEICYGPGHIFADGYETTP